MLTSENGNDMVMPVAPMYGGHNNNGAFGGDWAWIILLLLLAGNGWGNGYGNNAPASQAATLYPWMNQADVINSGFQNAALNDSVTAINSAITNGFANAESAAASRQMAGMNHAFAAQTAMSQGFNNVSSQLANCCCENRLATANLSALVQSENCSDRQALSDGVRDIIANQTAGTQRIIDMMCQDKIDAKNERIAELQQQLTLANLAASQNAQTATILANNEAQTTALEQYLAPVPRPAYIVQNPNCCGTAACGCGTF